MNKNIGIILVLIVVAGLGFLVYSSNLMKNNIDTISDTAVVQIDKEPVQFDNEKKVQADTEIVQVDKQTVQAGSYEAYSPEKLSKAATGDVLLFFHASWCPSCRSLNKNIEENIASIPEGLTILKLDYDNQTELKKKYGVTTQHTLVQVDASGTMIKKWSGGSKLENILSQLQ